MSASSNQNGYRFRIIISVVTLFHLSLVNSLAQDKMDTLSIESLLTKATAFMNSHPDSLLLCAKKSLSASEAISYTRGIMKAHKIFGAHHWLKMEFDSSITAYEQALRYSILLKDYKTKNELYLNIGMVFSKLGDYPQAIKFLLNSASGSDSISDFKTLGSAYNSLAVAYLHLHNMQQAKYFIQQGIEVFIRESDSVNLAGAFSNFGNIYKREGNLAEARNMFDSALNIFTKKEVPRGVVTCLNNLSGIYLLQNSADTAKDLAIRSLELSKKYGFAQNEIIALMSIADSDFRLGNFESSKGSYLQALMKISESNYSQQLPKVHQGLGELLLKKGDFKEAAKHLNLYAHLRDSLASEELANTVSNTRIAYEINKRKSETDLLAKNLEIAKLRSRLTLIIALSVVGGLLTLLIFIILNYRRRKHLQDQKIEKAKADFEISQLRLENQQLKELELRHELGARNRELSTHTLHLLQKNELLSEIRKELKGMSVPDAKAKSSISRILSNSSLSSYQDKEWEFFRQYFDSAYGGFFDKLSFLNPDLTPYDKRLAALTRLELTGEQIASIMGISVSSVKVSKHRLRKKLDISDSVILGNFLIELDSNPSLGLTDFTHVIELIAKNLERVATIEEAYWMVAKNCIQYLRLEDCAVYEVSWDDRILRQRAAYSFDGNQRIRGSCNFQLPVDSGICGFVAKTGQTVLTGDTSLDSRYVIGETRRYSELAVAIFVNGSVKGVIDSENSRKHFFMKNHAMAMEKIAALLATKITEFDSINRKETNQSVVA